MAGRLALVVLSLVGAAMMTYLAYLHFSSAEGAFCNLGEGFSCDVVNQSLYSVVLGVPFALVGLGYFLALLVAAWRYTPSILKLVAIASIIFLGPSLYLTGIEIFVLKSICIFCELSKLLMALVVVVAVLGMRPTRLTSSDITGALVFAVIIGGLVALLQGVSAAGPRGKYHAFATCLSEAGMRMYGSSTCSSCGRQRQMFGDAFQLIEEIECDPRNPDNEAERCVALGIDKTPTWVREVEGVEIARFDPGVQTLEALGAAADCPVVADR